MADRGSNKATRSPETEPSSRKRPPPSEANPSCCSSKKPRAEQQQNHQNQQEREQLQPPPRVERIAFVTTTGTSLVTPPHNSVVGNTHVFESLQTHETTPSSTSKRSVSVNRTRNEMMMEALLQLQVGNIDPALALVANAFSLFESEMNSINRGGVSSRHQCNYLPALLFLLCLRSVTDDHVALHQHIPACLSQYYSRALSSFEGMRTHCMRVLKVTNETNKTDLDSEWDDFVSTASLRGNITAPQQQSVPTSSGEQSWSCMYFVALWMLYCRSDNQQKAHGYTAAHIFADMSSSHYASTTSAAEERSNPTVVTCSVGQIRWCVSSVTHLGICYDHGVGGVDKDTHKAVTLYQRAADAGNGTAMFNLASCYDSGEGVEKDIYKAVSLFQRATDAGNVMAMFNLAVCHENGDGVDQDTSKALELYQRSADAGNLESMLNLGVCYENGDGVARDARKAVTLYQRAADAGYAEAISNLGCCYVTGNGVEKDIHKAVSLYQMAADSGQSQAMYNLGCCYVNGTGVDKDIHKAVSLYQRAADAGNAWAMNNLGVCYKSGIGVEKDVHQAMRLWLRAAGLGHVGATDHVRCLQSKSNTKE